MRPRRACEIPISGARPPRLRRRIPASGARHFSQHLAPGGRNPDSPMRMVLIGDLQYQLGEEREILQSFAQLRALAPDLAVSMGDMGAPRELGRERGMSACAQLLKVLRRPVFALLGNHDVEYPPDAPLSGAYPAYYNALFGEPQPWKAFEWNGFFLLCLSIERQPFAGLRTRHGLYLSDGQFEWAKISFHATKITPPLCSAMHPWRAADCGACRNSLRRHRRLPRPRLQRRALAAICSLRIRKFACGVARTFIWGRITARQSPGRTK